MTGRRTLSRVASVVTFAMAAWMVATMAARPARAAGIDTGSTRDFRYLMGTSVRVEVYGGTREEREAAAVEAFGSIAEVDRLMSDYRPDSELTRLNQTAAARPVAVSDPMFAVLAAADRVSRASGGAFDVTVGPLVQLWGFKDKRPHEPTQAELATLRGLVDFHGVILDSTARTVRFAHTGMSIDLGGIAKGFAVEVAAQAIRRRGLSGLVDAGGNQFMIGLPPGKRTWSVGISRPDAPGQLLGVLDVAGGSLSTSSNASNVLTGSKGTYGHLLDPRSLTPSGASLGVTIVSPDGTLADALSKAVFVLGPREGLALLDAFPTAAGVVIAHQPDGRLAVTTSPNLMGRFHQAAGL